MNRKELKNLTLITIFFMIVIIIFSMCSSSNEITNEGTNSNTDSNTGDPDKIQKVVPFTYPVPDGMIEDPAEREAMIDAKIENLLQTNVNFWGKLPGDPDTILTLFADIWGYINTYFPGFKGIDIDWDEFGDIEYAKLEEAQNYGEFASIMTYMAYVLEEGHSQVITGRLEGKDRLAAFKKDAPIFIPYTYNLSRIGACYTVTDEEELVVTKIIDKSNPYNFKPGDEIVGYNGVPWQEWVEKLANSGLPIYGSPASAKEAIKYNLLKAGMTNPNLFEKINIKRYDTGEIETLPIEYIRFKRESHEPCTEYIGDVPGVKTPAMKGIRETMNSGIMEDKNIGYLYLTECPSGFDEFSDSRLWDPYETSFSELFEKSILNLLETDGLIIDLRYNVGGRDEPLYKGLSHLIAEEEDKILFRFVSRDTSIADKYLLVDMSEGSNYKLKVDEPNLKYEKPIVVLTGPDCISACDFLVAALAKFPEFTIIGKTNNGSFTGVSSETFEVGDDKVFRYIPSQTAFYYDDDGEYLLRRSDFVDIQIWYNKDDIAKGIDTVREYAIKYIEDYNND